MQLTWFGHSSFRLDFDGAQVLIDPFLNGNPSFKGDFAKATADVSHILLTHGHSDHVGDTIAIAKQSGAKVIGNYETCLWVGEQGVSNYAYLNHGGGADFGPFHVTLTQAIHSSTELMDGQFVSLGNPAGIVLKPKSGPVVYAMGDTDVFGDMAIINDLHAPDVVLIPIGDRFTMGPRSAAYAIKRFFPHVKTIIPCHYGTFPPLTGTPEAFKAELGAAGSKLRVLASGESTKI